MKPYPNESIFKSVDETSVDGVTHMLDRCAIANDETVLEFAMGRNF